MQMRPIESRSVVERVTAELRRSILAGALEPGQEFGQRELAEMLNVSFIPVREAMRTLEGEGLILTRPGRSAMIASPDLADLRGIYRLRLGLEPEIVTRSCALLPERELDRLADVALRFSAANCGADEVHDAHWAFHIAILAPVATEWDLRILTTLWRAAQRYVRIGFGRLDPERPERARFAESHHRLVDMLRSRDPEAVRAATREHLEHEESIAMRALELDDAALERAGRRVDTTWRGRHGDLRRTDGRALDGGKATG
jgi:DNA-binding GntR family transcriptional regulator